MAPPVSGNPELGRTSDRPKFFCPRTGPEDRSNFDPHFLFAQSKDLDESITTTPSSDPDSNVFDFNFTREVGDEHHSEATDNRSKRHSFNATSYDEEIPKTTTMNQPKGIIAAQISGPQEVESVDPRTFRARYTVARQHA